MSGIDSVEVKSIQPSYCYLSDAPCGYTIDLEFGEAGYSGWAWYWVGLRNMAGRLIPIDSGHILNAGARMRMQPRAFYYKIDPGTYFLEIYRCTTSIELYDPKKGVSAGTYGDTINIGAFGTNCLSNCCSNELRRYWTGAVKQINDVVGAEAVIVTRYGQLCGEMRGIVDSAQSNAFISINEALNSPSGRFVQLGYGRFRRTMTSQVTERLYYEWFLPGMAGPYEERIVEESAPVEGQGRRYEVFINHSTSGYELYYSYEMIRDYGFGSHYWPPTMGKYVVWSGEISGWETDMPGEYSTPCEFDDCQYRTYGGPKTGAEFTSGDLIFTLDSKEWGIEPAFGYNYFKIWDISPAPPSNTPQAGVTSSQR